MDKHAAADSNAFPFTLLKLLALIVVGAAVALIGASEFLERKQRREDVEHMEWMEATAIGAENPPGPDNFFPVRVVERQPLVSGFEILDAEHADQKMRPRELVIGVEIDEHARAYSLNTLNGPIREIINDNLAGIPLAATWCHLCRTAVVFDRRVDERQLTFGVSGQLWENNLVMYDAETDTKWSQMLGEAMQGELAGAKLRLIPASITDWRTWRAQHPETTLAYLPPTVQHHFSGAYDIDDGMIIGLTEGPQAQTWSIADLSRHPVLNQHFGETPILLAFDLPTYSINVYERTVDGRELHLAAAERNFAIDRETETRWELLTGRAVSGSLAGSRLRRLPAITSDAASWSSYHPHSRMTVVTGNGDPQAAAPVVDE